MKNIKVLILPLCLMLAANAYGQRTGNSGGIVTDKTVATVNNDLITYSDLLWQLALQPDTPLDNPGSEKLNGALNLIIDQRLIVQEAEKLPTIAPTDKEIDAALAELIKRFSSRAEFEARARRVGLTSEQLREIVRQRVEIEKYLDFRFRSFVVVTPQEITDYYRDVYVPRFRQRAPGRIVPKFEEVRAEIEKRLTESKIESNMGEFIDELRGRAEIITLSPV